MTTPPGWYPDPGHTGPGPVPERWWDGSAWTEHTRAPSTVPGVAYGAYDPRAGGAFSPGPGPVPGPAHAHEPREGNRSPRGPLVAAVIAVAVVVSALMAGGLLLLGGFDGGDRTRPEAGDGASRTPGGDGKGPGGTPEEERPDDTPGTATDRANGVSVPVLEGWTETETDRGVWLATGSYPCPGEPSLTCVRGGVSLRAAERPPGSDVKEAAEEDIARNAEESYDTKGYGGVRSHRVVSAGEVTVAGRQGYRVRWRIVNEMKPDAYVESVVFPAPDDSGRLLVLRLGFDIHAEAPDVGDMDRIVSGVRAARGPGLAV
ncbi:DUF2510 domain-containing protein [Streptomyces taklimakanensis]|nr:DUF2510 domain-containing protein [Streptomyces taklimakanensis]